MMNIAVESTVEASTLVDLLRMRASATPEEKLYTFLLDGQSESVHLTYGELERRARAIAARLQAGGARGERVLLLYPPGLEYISAFFGCLYAGAVAVPAYPPRLNRNLGRLQAIISDAGAAVALTTTQILCGIQPLLFQVPELKSLQWVATDNIDSSDGDGWQEPDVEGESLAFLQYTSGSTSTPKGVMLTHQNLLHNSAFIARNFEGTPIDAGVSWLPPYHDMGLIGGILQPLYVGGPMTLMSPMTFLQRPLRWLQAISASKGRFVISGGPDFAYDLCIRKISPQQMLSLDLSRWELAFTGAEQVRKETLDRFTAAFRFCGFRRQAFFPCYGLAEATLMVSGGPKSARPLSKSVEARALEQNLVVEVEEGTEGSRDLIGCGRMPADQRTVIADTESFEPCPPERVGEIWVSGESVARGYWGRSKETEETFGARLAASLEGPFLRTGDLGFIRDGELFVTGRLKDLIIIDGRNHYPHDIELTVQKSHQAIKPGACAAFSVDLEGREQLVVMAEVEREYRNGDLEEVNKIVRQAVAEQHDLRVHQVLLLRTIAIPRTSSGKIQRYACRANYLSLLAAGSD